MQNSALGIDKNDIRKKTVSNIQKMIKSLMPRTLSVIINYKDEESMSYIVLLLLTFDTYFNYVAL